MSLAARLAWPDRRIAVDARRAAPVLVAATLAAAYLAAAPLSIDLPAQLFRAALFQRDGFVLWNNLWYSGHDVVGYSVLFPPVAALLTPQLAAALAATATAGLFEALARRHFGPDAWVGATVFGAATAISLFSGRLALAFGALPAMGALLALDVDARAAAVLLAALSALCSPVAALFAALAAAGQAGGRLWRLRTARPSARRLPPGTLGAVGPGLLTAAGALVPVGLLAIAFPEGGREPFALSTLWPLLLVCPLAVAVLPRRRPALRAGAAIYAVAVLTAFLIPSPVGSNIARLGTALAAPVAALAWWPRHRRRLVLVALPLLYLGWLAPVRDVVTASTDPAAQATFYAPLLRFLAAQTGPPFRVEIPFTASHEEAYAVGLRFPLARGWERQLDIAENPVFYAGRLTPTRYAAWLHRRAVRFVALPNAPLDYSARSEARLIERGLPYLREVLRSGRWRVYAVAAATPIVSGAARLTALTPDSVSVTATRPGRVLVRIHFTPYWTLTEGNGCVAPAGQDTRITLTRSGPATLATRFAVDRIGATSPRCRG